MAQRALSVLPGGRYAQAALRGELDRVVQAPTGERNDTLYLAALKLGSLVGLGRRACLIHQTPRSPVLATAERRIRVAQVAASQVEALVGIWGGTTDAERRRVRADVPLRPRRRCRGHRSATCAGSLNLVPSCGTVLFSPATSLRPRRAPRAYRQAADSGRPNPRSSWKRRITWPASSGDRALENTQP